MPEHCALLRLMHLGIAPILPVLGRARRPDECRIHQRSLSEQQAVLSQSRIDRLEDPLRQIMLARVGGET